MSQSNNEVSPAFRQVVSQMANWQKLIDDQSVRIPEPIFAQHILPVLTQRTGHQDLDVWKEVAGNVMRALDVYDPQTEEILFRVPPILRSVDGVLPSREQLGQPINEVLATTQLKSKRLQRLGEGYFNQEITNRVTAQHPRVDDIRAWNAVLARYGYEPIIRVEPAPSEETDQPEANDDDDFFSGGHVDL